MNLSRLTSPQPSTSGFGLLPATDPIQTRMERAHRKFGILRIDDTGDLDLRRADHHDVDPFLRQDSNIVAATPEWDRMPTPTIETFAIASFTAPLGRESLPHCMRAWLF